MCGRAGRPPFDDTGTVIIMTRKGTVHLYKNLLSGCEMVESQLLSCIAEHLNAEIVQLAVSDITMAIEWLKCSYLYVRIRKTPESYGIKTNVPGKYLEKHIQEICMGKVNELFKHGMISMDEDGFLLKPLEPGNLMAKYYLRFGTMIDIVNAPESCTLVDVLHVVCRSEELSCIHLRRNQKKLLNDVNYDKDGRLRFHVVGENGKRKRRIQTREEKIFVLANDCLTGDPVIHDLSLSQDVSSICSNGCRIAKCLKECFIHQKSYKGALNSSLLAKCLHHRLWDTSPYLLKQLPGIGMVTAKALNSAGIKSFKDLEDAEPRKIEIITGRKYPFGNHIKESLLSLPPKIGIKITEDECKRQGKTKLVIVLTRLSHGTTLNKRHYADMVVGSEEDNLILFHEKLRVEEFSSPYSFSVTVPCVNDGKVTVRAVLIFEEYVGLDICEKHVVTGESNFTQFYPRQRCPSTYTLPKEISAVEDGKVDANLETASKIQDSPKRTFSARQIFELSSEEEGLVTEAPDMDEDCQIITEQMVFEHIRKKSKNLPSVPKSDAMDSAYEPLILKQKHRRINQQSPGASDFFSSDVIIDSPLTHAPVSSIGDVPCLKGIAISPLLAERKNSHSNDPSGTDMPLVSRIGAVPRLKGISVSPVVVDRRKHSQSSDPSGADASSVSSIGAVPNLKASAVSPVMLDYRKHSPSTDHSGTDASSVFSIGAIPNLKVSSTRSVPNLKGIAVSPVVLDHRERSQSNDPAGTDPSRVSRCFSTPSIAVKTSGISTVAGQGIGTQIPLLLNVNMGGQSVRSNSIPDASSDQESPFLGFKSIFSFL